MTYFEEITILPEDQRRAAHALMQHADERAVNEAVHAHVPDPIVSFLSGESVRRVHAIADAVDERDRDMARRMAP